MNLLQANELNDWKQEKEQVEEKKHFEITGLDSLNWAFRKLAAFKAKEAEITELAKKERERIDFWEAEQKKTIQAEVEFFESLINQYHAKVLQEDPKAKTLSTPYGKSKARKSKAQPDKTNEKEILQHVLDNNMEEYIKPSLKWADLKKSLRIVEVDGKQVAVDENGQVVPGVTIKPEEIKYSVEVE
jgi:thioesterase domain-containing protein